MSFNGDLYSTDEGLELTTKGQIHTHNASANVGLGVSGNNDYVLVEDSTTATGLAWKVNAHSSVTPSSTTTFTNKSIDFGTNTMTSTLAQLDTALSTTGTASSSTFLRGDNSWASISAGDGSISGTCQFPSKNHFFEGFTYKDITNTSFTDRWGWWNTTDATAVINTGVKGGITITSDATRSYSESGLGFVANTSSGSATALFKPYSETGSVCQYAMAITSSLPNSSTFGFSQEGRGDGAGANTAIIEYSYWDANWNCRTVDNASAQNDTDSGVAQDTATHNFRVECKASSVEFSIDGVLVATSTANLPTTPMMLVFATQNLATPTGSIVYDLFYVEGYNT